MPLIDRGGEWKPEFWLVFSFRLRSFRATVVAEQYDYYEAVAPAGVADVVGDGAGPGIAAGPVCADACGSCMTNCDCCEPWRLFCQCEEGWNFYGWMNARHCRQHLQPGEQINGPYNAVDRANEFMLNQMYFIAEKKLPGDGCYGIGGRVDVIYGEDYFLAQSVGLENHDDGTPHWNPEFYGIAIPQAYLEMGTTDLSLKVGHFYSIIGYEGLPAVGNFFYSKAYSYQFAGPFTHWGGLATWTAERLLGTPVRPDEWLGYARSRTSGQFEHPGESQIHG